MTSVPKARNDESTDLHSKDVGQSRTAMSFGAPSFASYSHDAVNPHAFNKENVQEEAIAFKTASISSSNAPSIQRNAPSSFHTQDEDSHSAFPMPPPMMRYTTSAAFSDITLPFPYLASSQSFDRHGRFLHPPQMTELCSYSSAVQPPFHGTSSVDTPMQEDGMKQHPVTERRQVPWPLDSDLSLVASALLDLTPSVINQNMQQASANTKATGKKRASQKHLPRSASIDALDWNPRVESFPSPALAPTKYNAKMLVVLRAQELLEEDIPFTLHSCRCKHSHCLKLYCNCFQSGTFCDPLICVCNSCENSAEHSVPRGSRTRAIYDILNRRIDAFEPRPKKKLGQGCSCKKSRYVFELFCFGVE